MYDPAPRACLLARLAPPAISLALLAATATAQYNSGGFEALTASAGGTLLTGQDTWTLPVTSPVSVDWKAYTYAGNTLSIPNNPFGGLNFCSGNPVGTSLGRGERVVPFAITSNKYTLSVDVYCKYIGTGTPVNNIGGFSLQPSTTARYTNMIMTWPVTPTGATWDAGLMSFTAANVANSTVIPNPAFQNLATNKWYRWQVDFDFGTNAILGVRITDIVGGTTASYVPTGWYLFGGSAPTNPLPTSVRMFAGGDAGNLVASDNLELREMSALEPGKSVATVAVSTTPATGEMYVADHQANTSTKLTLSAALTAERVNCVTMDTTSAGWVGTNSPITSPVTPSNVYAISISGTTVTETKLNTTACVGPNLSQITRVGSNLYFCTQDAANTAGSGVLQSVPVSGGAVTTVSNLSTLAGFTPTNGGANCIAAIGTNVYVGAFDSNHNLPANVGWVAEHDTVANTTKILMALPVGKCQGTSAPTYYNTGICYAQNDGGLLGLFGIFGDYLKINTATATIVSHTCAAAINPASGGYANALFNSFDLDPRTGDLICGSRDGRINRIASNSIAQLVVPGVGSFATPTGNSVNGVAHIPANTLAAATSYGPGCPGNLGFTLTDVPSGLPSAGNAGFQLGAYSGTGGDLVAVLLSVGQLVPGIDLGIIGMPGCLMHIPSVAVSVGGTLAAGAAGTGFLRIPLSVPSTAVGAIVYTQWIEVQATKTNILGVVVSNARKLEVK